MTNNRRQDGANQGRSNISITAFFPCHNEQENVRRVVSRAVEVLAEIGADFEVIVVNDGSKDATGAIADEMAEQDERVRVVHHPGNRGYGAALQSGFKAAKKEFTFYTDGDGQFDIAELPALIALMDEYDIVSCYRRRRQDNLMRRINGWGWTKLVCLLFHMRVRDIDCAFKLYRSEIFDNIEMVSTGALIDTEILARSIRKGYRVVQRPVNHYPRSAGEQSGASPAVILRAFRELLKLRRRILRDS